MQLHSAHIAKLDHTLKVLDCTTCFQAFGCFPHTFAANALSRPFRLRDFHFFLRLSLRWPFPCSGSFAVEPHSLQNQFYTRCSWFIEETKLVVWSGPLPRCVGMGFGPMARVSNGSGPSLWVRVRVQTKQLPNWRSGSSINPNCPLGYVSMVNSQRVWIGWVVSGSPSGSIYRFI